MGHQGYGIDSERLGDYARQIAELRESGVEVGIVIGGGNIFRGLSGAAKGFDRVKGDQMGMLATVINSLALSSALESIGCPARVLTSIGMFPIGEPYSPSRAIETLTSGTVTIIAGGTGNPFFTTDTASALRAVEIKAQVMLIRAHASTASIPPTPRKTPQPPSSTRSATTKSTTAVSVSWTSPPPPSAAKTA